ncbi:MAG: hypothetical protein ABIO57_03040 [Candidatus Paceibacterota bacterium]
MKKVFFYCLALIILTACRSSSTSTVNGGEQLVSAKAESVADNTSAHSFYVDSIPKSFAEVDGVIYARPVDDGNYKAVFVPIQDTAKYNAEKCQISEVMK